MRDRGRVARRVIAAVAVGLFGATAAPLPAQEAAPAGVTVDHVRVERNGRHEVWVSVLDAHGFPVQGLGPQLSVEEDGRIVHDLEVIPLGEHQSAHQLTVLVDKELLQPSEVVAVQQLLLGLGKQAGERDRFVVRTTGRRSHFLTGATADLKAMGERLAELGENGGDEFLYDAVLAEVRDLARGGRAHRGLAVLLATRGVDRGSRSGPLEVLAVARARRIPVTISAILVEDRGPAPEAERLVRLCLESGGAALRVRAGSEIADAASRLVARAWGGYILRFRPPRWEPAVPNHTLTVAVEASGASRRAHREFMTSAVLVSPWWRLPLPWVALGAAILLAGAGFLFGTRRRLCRLVVAGGVEEGCQYEIFVLPLRIGASEANDLTFPQARVSRHHAVLERRQGSAVELVDLNSENGTFVNGDAITRRRLVRGDRISLGGEVELIFDGKG